VNETPQPELGPPVRTPWQRHVIDPVAAQLTQGITPEKIALTLSVGSALALFPILGTTTLLCLLAGILLRLNQPIIQIVNALCTPIHLPVIYFLVRMGTGCSGSPSPTSGIGMMNHMLWEDPREFFERFGQTPCTRSPRGRMVFALLDDHRLPSRAARAARGAPAPRGDHRDPAAAPEPPCALGRPPRGPRTSAGT
jgi:hypothetical protein